MTLLTWIKRLVLFFACHELVYIYLLQSKYLEKQYNDAQSQLRDIVSFYTKASWRNHQTFETVSPCSKTIERTKDYEAVAYFLTAVSPLLGSSHFQSATAQYEYNDVRVCHSKGFSPQQIILSRDS